MITIEAHDSDYDNTNKGTLVATIGRRHGTIEYEYQAEQWLTDFANDCSILDRAYFLRDGEPIAAWRHDGAGVFSCIGHSSSYGGTWRAETPYVYPDAMLIASAHLGRNALTGSQEDWAHRQLAGATATAILLDEQGIVAAWEPGAPDIVVPTLTARGPRRS